MAKNDGPVMVRMIHDETGQPVTVAEDKVARMPSGWSIADGEKVTDPRESAKADARKADKARATARSKAEKEATAAAADPADGTAPADPPADGAS